MSRRQIGFVFSNSTHSTRFGFRASDFRQNAGKLGLIGFELALNWLCFLAAKNLKNPHNTLSYRYLISCCPFENWLCFFKFSSNFRRFSLTYYI